MIEFKTLSGVTKVNPELQINALVSVESGCELHLEGLDKIILTESVASVERKYKTYNIENPTYCERLIWFDRNDLSDEELSIIKECVMDLVDSLGGMVEFSTVEHIDIMVFAEFGSTSKLKKFKGRLPLVCTSTLRQITNRVKCVVKEKK